MLKRKERKNSELPVKLKLRENVFHNSLSKFWDNYLNISNILSLELCQKYENFYPQWLIDIVYNILPNNPTKCPFERIVYKEILGREFLVMYIPPLCKLNPLYNLLLLLYVRKLKQLDEN